jgi:glycosyltransferase involved in cell wall biosynthesis
MLYNKIYVIATLWSQGGGGGEAFMEDTMEYAHKLGMKVYWLAFANMSNKTYDRLQIIKSKYGTYINIPDGFSKDVLLNWLKLLKPDIIHHQGLLREDFYNASKELRTEFLTGFHFWNDGIELDVKTYNTDILKNKHLHKAHKVFEYLKTQKYFNFYCASKFVQECFQEITKVFVPDIIYPSSSSNKYLIDNYEPWNSKYVVMINIHKLKGGYIFYHLLKNCKNVNFLCVRTEDKSKELDELIKKEIQLNHPNSVYMEKTNNIKNIYSLTKIMLCISLVDETFCRVVNEAMMNGIPVLSTHKGNIKYLLGGTSPILSIDNYDEWIKTVETLYNNKNMYDLMSKMMREKYKIHSDKIASKQFENVIYKTILKSKEMNIGILTPWTDQGLGIQSKNYNDILKDTYNIFIFGIKPYHSQIDKLKDTDYWKHDNIYHSPNSREDIKDIEIIDFCYKYNIGKFIIPETCWFRIFEIAQLLKTLNVKTYAIPNIEIVRYDELHKHNLFYKILCNNNICLKHMKKLKVNTEYVGYGINTIELKEKEFKNDIIKFLFIGGLNAFTRKQVVEVCESFCLIDNKNIYLTVTIQLANEEHLKILEHYRNNKNITFITEQLSRKEILELYYTHHINIQVSKHEGLGLGFYESILTGTPCISLNVPPHNEVILDNVNGWLIDSYYKKMVDNDDSLLESAYFNTQDLANKINEIGNKESVISMINSLKQDIKNRLDIKYFRERFINSLN